MLTDATDATDTTGFPCGCAERKEIMFTSGKPDKWCVAVLIGFPAIAYLAGKMVK